MATSPVLFVYYPPSNDDSWPGVPGRHITEADWASFTIAQRRTVENATTQEGYTRRKVWVHRDLVDETEEERAQREAAEQAARAEYDRKNSLVRYGQIEAMIDQLEVLPPAEEFAALRQDVDAVADVPARVDDLERTVASALVPAELPAIPGLFAHWDAQTITATDGSRIGSWADTVSGHAASQATEGQQPQYRISGINGRPALYFDTARNDALLATGLSPTSNTVTIFAVMIGEDFATGARYFFGTNGHPKNLYHAANGAIWVQGGSIWAATGYDATPQIVAARFNGASSSVRVNTVQTNGDLGTQTSLPTTFSIGHRTGMNAGQGLTGMVGEVLYYDRVLTTDEVQAVEAYLSSHWGIPIAPQRVWYVDTVTGTASGDGRTADRANTSLSATLTRIASAAPTDATVYITAPADKPITETTSLPFSTGGTIRLASRSTGEKWHLSGALAFTGGWTSAGGGVYSRSVPLSFTNAPFAYVPTLLDADGQPTRIFARNTATPTTPAAGEYGYAGGTYYLHLPGDVDPNTHTVHIAASLNLIQVTQGTRVTIRDMHAQGAQGAVVLAGISSSAGSVSAIDSIAEFSAGVGWGTSGQTLGMKCERCVGRYVGNDGFNHHGNAGNLAIMELIDCEGAWNEDEGVSPHDDTRLILRGGVYHHNGSGGIVAVGNAQTQVYATEFHRNNRLSQAEGGGVAILENARLTSRDLYSHDHPGPGITIAATATWTDNGGTRSGTAHGNGAEDVT